MYNKIYFNKISKTSGTYIAQSVLLPLKKLFIENGIEILVPHENKEQHNGWHSKIDDNTYVLTILRNPLEQAVSFYTHSVCLDNRGKLRNDYPIERLTREAFRYAIESGFICKNMQSKAFIHDENNKALIYAKENIDYDIAFRNLQRVNLILDFNNIKGRYLDIQQKIINDLGIIGDPIDKGNEHYNYNPESKILFNKLTLQDEEHYRSYSPIDYKLYEESNFYKFDDLK